MKQIDMVKAFAELEGVAISKDGDIYVYKYLVDIEEYNPITDLALVGKAIIDHRININHEYHMCYPAGHTSSMANFYNETLGHAIIECILKSAGKWNEH